jgi:hypothetical protein
LIPSAGEVETSTRGGARETIEPAWLASRDRGLAAPKSDSRSRSAEARKDDSEPTSSRARSSRRIRARSYLTEWWTNERGQVVRMRSSCLPTDDPFRALPRGATPREPTRPAAAHEVSSRLAREERTLESSRVGDRWARPRRAPIAALRAHAEMRGSISRSDAVDYHRQRRNTSQALKIFVASNLATSQLKPAHRCRLYTSRSCNCDHKIHSCTDWTTCQNNNWIPAQRSR